MRSSKRSPKPCGCSQETLDCQLRGLIPLLHRMPSTGMTEAEAMSQTSEVWLPKPIASQGISVCDSKDVRRNSAWGSSSANGEQPC